MKLVSRTCLRHSWAKSNLPGDDRHPCLACSIAAAVREIHPASFTYTETTPVCRSILSNAVRLGSNVMGFSDSYHQRKDHSYLSASIGSSRDARIAGSIPLTNPTKLRMSVAMISVPGSITRRMSPASAC